MLDRGAGRLPVHQVAVHQGVLEERHHGVDVVLAHLCWGGGGDERRRGRMIHVGWWGGGVGEGVSG